MARTLTVKVGGTASSFSLRKLDRASVYGSKRRVPVDAEVADGAGDPGETQ